MTMWQLFQPVSFQIMWVTLIWGGNAWLPVSIAILVMHFVLSPSRLDDAKVATACLWWICYRLMHDPVGLL